jgi:hypothetical protein
MQNIIGKRGNANLNIYLRRTQISGSIVLQVFFAAWTDFPTQRQAFAHTTHYKDPPKLLPPPHARAVAI